ncbi:hypothetical protein RTBOTA2_001594 [Rhodotorula toruloides]|uniref:Uncharacterized protein n=1 Tax=Rhodotorula toruloides TaxID=5286 RepID=A0A0K3CH97_RHOTO|nr:hypothetical protein RTBOTA2_001594 [Rhodotorula toruloides]PRQ73776.1 hypothetical protein AAT19DRAFT_15343 [Rhodotorula toruloides]
MATLAGAPVRVLEPALEGDELPFGDFCFSCGNATQGSPYCSAECRKADHERSEVSPDDSPFLSAVPPLVSSGKSQCSTPPSSANNSPLVVNTVLDDLADPPSLDLPPPKHRFEYGAAQSLPAGMRYPATWTINYQADPLVSPMVVPTEIAPIAKDLSYRRKPGKPHSAVPSPLYFRQKAAAVHSSPAFDPTSPNSNRLYGFPPATDFSGAHVHEDDIATLALPDQHDPSAVPPFLPTPAHCGRPGCVGVPKRPRVEHQPKSSRRLSGPASPALRGLAPLDTSDDVLLSPRIRALRSGHHSPMEQKESSPFAAESTSLASGETPSSTGADDDHSAFACYLFSHLSSAAPPERERGRSGSIDHQAPDMQRSLSVDALRAARNTVSSSAGLASPAPPVRPRRGMLGGRGPAAVNMRSEPVLPQQALSATTTPEDESLPSSVSSRIEFGHDRDATVRPAYSRARDSDRMKLTPGHFISATTETPSGVSPFPSPPNSPPTAGRGRSLARRASDVAASSPDPRGRSKLRGVGALHRSKSPSARKQSRSKSRMTERSSSRERGRVGGILRESRGSRGTSDASSTQRGRGRAREEVREVDEDEEDERGRGRSQVRDSRSRSRSLLRRGRGREVVISMAAYGHVSDSDSER